MDDREAIRKAGDVARAAKARRKAEGKRTDPGVDTSQGGGGGCAVTVFAVIGAIATWKGWA